MQITVTRSDAGEHDCEVNMLNASGATVGGMAI